MAFLGSVLRAAAPSLPISREGQGAAAARRSSLDEGQTSRKPNGEDCFFLHSASLSTGGQFWLKVFIYRALKRTAFVFRPGVLRSSPNASAPRSRFMKAPVLCPPLARGGVLAAATRPDRATRAKPTRQPSRQHSRQSETPSRVLSRHLFSRENLMFHCNLF